MKHLDFTPHSTPTSASWMNRVERFSGEIAPAKRNRKDADRILRKVQNACKRIHPPEVRFWLRKAGDDHMGLHGGQVERDAARTAC